MFQRAVIALVAALASTTPAVVWGDRAMPLLTCRDGKIYEGDHEFRFVSWNIPNLHNVEDAFEFLGDSPWRWPDEFEIADALETVRQMGGQVARTYVISVRRDDGDMGPNVHVTGPGQFNEEAFRTLDLVLKIAAEKRIRVIVPLVDNWKWWGGARQYEQFRDKPEGAFWTDPQVREDFKQTVSFVVNRRNTLTGVLYRDDPAIFGWETGNEIDPTPEWTREMSAYLKQLDPNHLVIDGESLHGVPTHSLTDPNIDVVTTHHYPNTNNNTAESVREAVRQVAGRKAYFVGEFGFVAIDEAQRMLDAVIEEGGSGALYWSLRFRRREGGFYWHDEPAGENLFKAFHWPGFAEGDRYHESDVMTMLRDAAFKIRGLPTPPLPVPEPPRLLEPTAPGLLSWQGSAGAQDYTVQRATGADGPWSTIAEGVSDSALQYRPLYADESAEPGVAYWYRVVARNASGESTASCVVGPVVNDSRLFVDEFVDRSRLAATTAGVDLRSGNDRKTQEDIHRLALGPGSSVTYQFDDAVQRAELWVFSAEPPSIELAGSDDSEEFVPIEATRQSGPTATGDYGYLQPTLIKTIRLGADAGYSRLRVVNDGAGEVQLSRIEVHHGSDEQTQ